MLCMAQIEVMGERADVERGDVLRSLKYLEQYWASVDPVAQYGNMYRCHLDNGECQWLCPYHAAQARGNVELQKQQVIDAAQPLPRRPPPPISQAQLPFSRQPRPDDTSELPT